METFRHLGRRAFRAGRWEQGNRALPTEVPVALVYNGTTQAVMMATPARLEEFAVGFSLTEQIITDPSEIREIEIVETDKGIELRIWLDAGAETRFQARRRAQVGPVGCGLCGIDSLTEALRDLPGVSAPLPLHPRDIADAMSALSLHQALHDATRAAHAAGFFVPGQGMVHAAEDVGRHNALDKLAGMLARAGVSPASGIIVITSRVSVDMVQKAAVIGAPVLVAASAPTALAVEQAGAAGLTLIAIARGTDFEIFTHPERLSQGPNTDVA
jgi:FdhD protein